MKILTLFIFFLLSIFGLASLQKENERDELLSDVFTASLAISFKRAGNTLFVDTTQFHCGPILIKNCKNGSS